MCYIYTYTHIHLLMSGMHSHIYTNCNYIHLLIQTHKHNFVHTFHAYIHSHIHTIIHPSPSHSHTNALSLVCDSKSSLIRSGMPSQLLPRYSTSFLGFDDLVFEHGFEHRCNVFWGALLEDLSVWQPIAPQASQVRRPGENNIVRQPLSIL